MQKCDIMDTNENNAERFFKTISWLDTKRWEKSLDGIHYPKGIRLSDDEKILVHWLCYITDRQMPFEKIWKSGGQVFSNLVYAYTKKKTNVNDLLDPKNKNNKSFYLPKRTVAQLINDKELGKELKKRGGKTFVSKGQRGAKPVLFASRYVTDDRNTIKTTLLILDKKFKRSLTKFIKKCIERFGAEKDFLKRTTFALFLLTYSHGKKRSSTKAFEKFEEEFEEGFEKQYETFKKNSTKGKKRVWCCIRDYIKPNSPHRKYLINQFNQRETTIWDKATNKMMDQLEVPGDVWNNNPIFREKLLENIFVKTKEETAKMIRSIYDAQKDELKTKNIKFYPEQLDLTFDFIPKMCSNPKNILGKGEMCKICIFGNHYETGLLKYCHEDKNKNCPITIYACGYTTKCQPKNCQIKERVGENLCKTINDTEG